MYTTNRYSNRMPSTYIYIYMSSSGSVICHKRSNPESPIRFLLNELIKQYITSDVSIDLLTNLVSRLDIPTVMISILIKVYTCGNFAIHPYEPMYAIDYPHMFELECANNILSAWGKKYEDDYPTIYVLFKDGGVASIYEAKESTYAYADNFNIEEYIDI